MKITLARLPACLTLVALAFLTTGCVVEPVYGRGGYVGVAPPSLIVESRAAAPGPGYLWIDGYWGWTGARHFWVPGRWTAPRRGYSWVPHEWVQSERGWKPREGHWERSHR